MTEKRFGFEMDKNCYKCIADVIDKKLYTDKKQVVDLLNQLNEENEQLKQQIQQLKEDAPLLLAFYRWYPFAVEKKEHQAYNRLWDFVND